MKEILNELQEIKEMLLLEQPVLSLKRFCMLADISVDYARKLIDSGQLPAYRPFGRKLFIDRKEGIESLKRNNVGLSISNENTQTKYFLQNKTAA